MKIYTRTGDDGTTALFGGGRVNKDHLRIDAYGTVDETNSVIGWAVSILPENEPFLGLRALLTEIQENLFVVGGDLATPGETTYPVPRIDQAAVDQLEVTIDRFENDLPPLKSFILPGGSQASAAFHIARTVCRRAERSVVTLAREEPVNVHIVPYLNRLSDLLFSLSRWTNLKTGVSDIIWSPS